MPCRTIPKSTYYPKHDRIMKKIRTMGKRFEKVLAIPCNVCYNRVYPKNKGCENWQLNISHLDYWNRDGAWNGNLLDVDTANTQPAKN